MTTEKINKEEFLQKKFMAKMRSTKGRLDKNKEPIEFKLTFEHWCSLWIEAGVMPAYPYVLSRNEDIGHYELGNVYVSHNVINVTEAMADQSDMNWKISAYAIKTGYKRRIVKSMIKRGMLTL